MADEELGEVLVYVVTREGNINIGNLKCKIMKLTGTIRIFRKEGTQIDIYCIQ